MYLLSARFKLHEHSSHFNYQCKKVEILLFILRITLVVIFSTFDVFVFAWP